MVDYRVYNAWCKPPSWPMPSQETILNDISTSDIEFLNASDIATGYHHCPLTPEESSWLTVAAENAVYFPKKLTLGPTWAPAFFQNQSRIAFRKRFHVYIDDIVFKATSIQDLCDGIKEMLEDCERSGFVLSLKKTHLGVKTCTVLGHEVNVGQGRGAGPNKVALIADWKINTLQQLRSFVCLCVYLRDYISDFPQKVLPLREYLKEKPWVEFAEDKLAHRAVNLLKNSLKQGACISAIDYDGARNYRETGKMLMVHLDASSHGESFSVSQSQGWNLPPKICHYKQRQFTDQERKWSTYERELHCIKWFLESQAAKMVGGLPVILWTDHKNCGKREIDSVFYGSSTVSEKIIRWAERIILQFQRLPAMRRWHLPGALNIVADAGSRECETLTTTTATTEMPEFLRRLNQWLFSESNQTLEEKEQLVHDHDKEHPIPKRGVAMPEAEKPPSKTQKKDKQKQKKKNKQKQGESPKPKLTTQKTQDDQAAQTPADVKPTDPTTTENVPFIQRFLQNRQKTAKPAGSIAAARHPPENAGVFPTSRSALINTNYHWDPETSERGLPSGETASFKVNIAWEDQGLGLKRLVAELVSPLPKVADGEFTFKRVAHGVADAANSEFVPAQLFHEIRNLINNHIAFEPRRIGDRMWVTKGSYPKLEAPGWDIPDWDNRMPIGPLSLIDSSLRNHYRVIGETPEYDLLENIGPKEDDGDDAD
ncbi:MAG: hypothetical protein NZ802_04575, partial [Candidatus Poseidoniales archaeon]|nr:hypothetical protein [Candidatus Poseidoniales archaeon]